MPQRVLVTGGAGFIGANLIRKLSAAQHQVTVFDNLSRGRREYLPTAEMLVEGDVCDTDGLATAMQGIDTVVHLAAYGSVVESVADPLPNFSINVQGTLSVLEAARRAGVTRLIFASTGGALIGEAAPPVDESSLPKPISPYGASKLCGEGYCHAYAKAYGMHTVTLRFANVYGPFSAHKKGAITKFIKCLLRDEPMPIFGDGSNTRDFLHVDDLCSGISRAIDADVASGEVFHLASGVETDILSLAKLLGKVAGKPEHACEFRGRRPGEVERNFARYDKANAGLGFAPTVPLEAGLRQTWQWYSERQDEVLAVGETDS